MKNRNFFILILAGLLAAITVACGGNQETEKAGPQDVGTPPSLSADSAGQNMIKLSEKEVKELHIKTSKVESKVENYKVIAPGVVYPSPKQVSIISAPVDGRIVNILANEGDYVRKGQVIMQMESLTFGSLVADYLQAKSEEDYQQNRLERIKKLVEKDINSESELERARSDYQRASASVNAAYSKLSAIGVSDKDIANYQSSEKIQPRLNIHAPINGTIDQRQVEMGQSINAYEKLERVIDPSRVLVKGYLSPQDGTYVKKGDKVNITHRKNRDQQVSGRISSINPGLDATNRSLVVNVPASPKNNWPLPGENVRIEVQATTPADVIMIPMDAVTYDGNKPIVFVQHAENKYEKRFLVITELRDQYALVQEGLQTDENIAISQVFTLKALSRYEQFAD